IHGPKHEFYKYHYGKTVVGNLTESALGTLTEVVIGKKIEIMAMKAVHWWKAKQHHKTPTLVELVKEHKEYSDKQLTEAKELRQKADQFVQVAKERNLQAKKSQEEYSKKCVKVRDSALMGVQNCVIEYAKIV